MCKENERVDEEMERIKVINEIMRIKYGKEFNKLYKKMLKQQNLSRIFKNEKYLIMFNLIIEFIKLLFKIVIFTAPIITLFLVAQHRTDKIGMLLVTYLILFVLSLGISIIYIIASISLKYMDYE